METSYETETKNTTANTWAGFWMMVFMAVLMVATWGEPDLIDSLIYYLSDGYYKQ
jgi:HEAT repeat protein